MNKVTLLGRNAKDVELRYSQQGNPVAYGTIAVKGYNNTDFLDYKCFKSTAENTANYTSKGSQILIEGHLQVEKWEKDGQKRSKVVVIADRVTFLSPKDNSGIPDNLGTEVNFSDDDIPF